MESQKKQPTVKLTSIMIANALDSQAAHTSFGKLPLARQKSQPIYSFGTGTRDQLNKAYQSQQLCINVAKFSQGPKYDVHDNINFKTPSSYSIPKDERVTLGKPQYYDHFSIQDNFSDAIRATSSVQHHYGSTKFGTESRMPVPDLQGTPGPQYYPPLKPEIPKSSEYTLGARRTTGGSVLQNQVSTPGLVGPGRYIPQESSYTSLHENRPHWSFGRGDKVAKPVKSITKHQTYERYTANGVQVRSQKKTEGRAKIGNATRDQVQKLGMFKSQMSTQPTSVRIPMPKF